MKRLLSFGLEPYAVSGYEVIHCPLIEVAPLPVALEGLSEATHIVFTSKTAVALFPYSEKPVLAIGKATAKKAVELGFDVVGIAKEETQEGMIELIEGFSCLRLFWPRSTGARPVLAHFCQKNGIPLCERPLYAIREKEVFLPDLAGFDALFFSSPSTVDAFFSKKVSVPSHVELLAIGCVTHHYLTKLAKASI